MVSGRDLHQWASRSWRRAHRQLGTSGLLGALLLVLAVALVATGPQLQRASEGARAELEQRRAGLQRPREPAPDTLTAQEQFDRYVGGFPPFAQNASDVKAVFAGAQRAHVALLKGDYALKADAGSPFITYTATFPVHENYAALKLFAAEVLQDLPHAALDELRMVRPEANGSVLDATVRFTFVYRRP
jgi:uncharacterized iron-regulated membrane protein